MHFPNELFCFNDSLSLRGNAYWELKFQKPSEHKFNEK